MSKFYTGNAIYNLIESTQNFKYTSDNLWLLVYGDRKCEPKIIICLSGYSKEEYKNETLNEKELEMFYYANQISKKSKVPFLYVRFNKDDNSLKEVVIIETEKFKTISLEDYINILIKTGIQKHNQSSKKPINSKASNVYHLWQINSGLDIITSDIDLMYVNSGMEIKNVYELKRSYITMDKWKPYPADYNNFILLSKLFIPCDINFYIMFNQYYKDPYKDDIRLVKLFKVEYRNELIIEDLGESHITDFLLSLK